MRKTPLTLQARIDGQHKRTDGLGIPALTAAQGKAQWGTHGSAAMYGRINRLAQLHKLANTRHKAGVITAEQFNRSMSRTLLRLRNIQYWQH